jgi:hypothetical protein
MKQSAVTPKATYVLVRNPGMENQDILGRTYYGTKEAYKKQNDLEEAYPDQTFDVMKQLEDGTLTTEF